MIEYNYSRFFRRYFDGAGEVYEGLRFDHCQFDNCSFSKNTNYVNDRTIARDFELIECEASNCTLGPGILDRVTINGLKTVTMPICWGTLFKNVTFKGNIGKIKINPETRGMDFDQDLQNSFDDDRRHFYSTLDWALDISEARFKEFDVRGIPPHLFRIDPQTQGFVSRESASQGGWRERVRSKNNLWLFVIDEFLRDEEPDCVIVVPKNAPKRRYHEFLDSFKELKDLGIIL